MDEVGEGRMKLQKGGGDKERRGSPENDGGGRLEKVSECWHRTKRPEKKDDEAEEGRRRMEKARRKN